MIVTVSVSADGQSLTSVGRAGAMKHLWVFGREP